MAPLLHNPTLSLAKQTFVFGLTFQILVPLLWTGFEQALVRRRGTKHSST
jgi:hypothetical protein